MIAKKYKDLAWKLFSIFVLIFAVVMTFVVGKLWFSYQEGKNIESRLENKFFAQGAVLRMQDQGENPMTYASGSFVKVDMVHKATGGVDVYEI